MDDTKEKVLELLKSIERHGIDKVMEMLEQSDFFYSSCKHKISFLL